MASTKRAIIIAPNHYTVSEYAKERNISRAAVYQHIQSGAIVPDIVGNGKQQMIDWAVYGKHVFAEPKWSEKKLRKKIKNEEKTE